MKSEKKTYQMYNSVLFPSTTCLSFPCLLTQLFTLISHCSYHASFISKGPRTNMILLSGSPFLYYPQHTHAHTIERCKDVKVPQTSFVKHGLLMERSQPHNEDTGAGQADGIMGGGEEGRWV